MFHCLSREHTQALLENLFDSGIYEGSGGQMDKVSASQPWDRGFKPHMGHDHDSSHDTSTGWFQEADSSMI